MGKCLDGGISGARFVHLPGLEDHAKYLQGLPSGLTPAAVGVLLRHGGGPRSINKSCRARRSSDIAFCLQGIAAFVSRLSRCMGVDRSPPFFDIL